MKLEKFKIRASSAGKIMSGTVGLTDSQVKEMCTLGERKRDSHENVPNVKPLTLAMEKRLEAITKIHLNPELPQTAKSYLDLWIKEQIYQRRAEFSSKYTDKGNIVEDNSLDFIAEYLGMGMLFKNEEFFEDDFFTGTPDAIFDDEDLVIDAKNPWSWETFPILDSQITNKDYFFQGHVYMHLTGKKRFKLCFVLSDTPTHLIEKEAFYYCKNNGYDGLDDDVLSDFTEKMTYGDIEDKYKIKVFDIDYDENVVKQLQIRVGLCRKYIKEKISDLGL